MDADGVAGSGRVCLDSAAMPTYLYETIPQTDAECPERFEVRQGMTEKALTVHPDSGKPVRRIILGGTGFSGVGMTSSAASTGRSAAHSSCCGGGSCCN
jgi:predicted nucleic acid-binding Zn ribbon protein